MKWVLLICCILSLISCDTETAQNFAEATLVVADAKVLTIDSPNQVVSYKYMATPLFEEENTFGKTEKFTVVKVDANKRASLGYYSQGKWHFEIRGYNKYGVAIVGGESDVYLQEGKENYITVNMFYKKLDGQVSSLELDFVTPALEDLPSSFTPHVYFTEIDWENGVTDGVRVELDIELVGTVNEKNQMNFIGNLTDLGQRAGLLEIVLLGPNDKYITGQSMICTFIAGAVTKVTGNLEGGAYIEGTLNIIDDKSEPGIITISGRNWTKLGDDWGSVQITKNTTEFVSCNVTELNGKEFAASRFEWYIDGKKVASGKTATIDFNYECGEHTLSCLVFNANGQKTGTGSIKVLVE